MLDKATLDDIQRVVKAGKASEYFKLGDELKVTYGSYTMPFQIVGFEDVEVQDGETKHAINLLAKYTEDTGSAWGANGETKYSGSRLHAYCSGTYQNKLDQDFVACLANTKVQTYNRDGSTSTVYSKLFAPSMSQLGVTNITYTTTQQTNVEGPAFTRYKGAADSRRLRYSINNTIVAQDYWTRSLYPGISGYFGSILTAGAPDYDRYDIARRVVAACNLIGD